MTKDEVAESMGEPHWFVAYSCTLQQVGEAASGWKWKWPAKEALEVKVSPLVCAIWEETGMDLTMACIKLLGTQPSSHILQGGGGPCSPHSFFLG